MPSEVIKIPYRGYVIEVDDEFGYIVTNGCVDLAEFGTGKDAREFIDNLADDVHEARRLGMCDDA